MPDSSAGSQGRRPLPIEDYALVGDCQTAALVGRDGSIDWLCWPRFDSAACFAALLGHEEHGHWSIAPASQSGAEVSITRSYRGDTMVLETVFATPTGAFALIDFMPLNRPESSLIRIVEGRHGKVAVHMCLRLRFDYGSSVPWVSRLSYEPATLAIAGPNLVVLRTPVDLKGENLSTVAGFEIKNSERIAFVLSYGESHRPPPAPIDPIEELERTEAAWHDWAAKFSHDGHRRAPIMRSLLTLKALTFAATGGIVAAPTTSLPEKLGGTRNWDYRYCWLRDATLTLTAMMGAGYQGEARAWREWLLRAAAGSPHDLHIMYGIGGERRIPELELDGLPGYQGAAPVRIGNAAVEQLQLDVWGELMDALHLARAGGLAASPSGWALQSKAMEHLERIWRDPDEGIWEMRGGRQHFTHSKVMAWVAFDRSIRDAETWDLPAPLERWRKIRDEIHDTVCTLGYDARRNTFTQSFGRPHLDANLLLIAPSGFLPIDDPRVTGTIAAVERELMVDGFVMRYRTESEADGLAPGEGVFLACSFWLADAWQQQGRLEEANALVDRLLVLANDLGLWSEEYDTRAKRLVGNFPQAFSHLAFVRTALSLHGEKPVREALETEPKPG